MRYVHAPHGDISRMNEPTYGPLFSGPWFSSSSQRLVLGSTDDVRCTTGLEGFQMAKLRARLPCNLWA